MSRKNAIAVALFFVLLGGTFIVVTRGFSIHDVLEAFGVNSSRSKVSNPLAPSTQPPVKATGSASARDRTLPVEPPRARANVIDDLGLASRLQGHVEHLLTSSENDYEPRLAWVQTAHLYGTEILLDTFRILSSETGQATDPETGRVLPAAVVRCQWNTINRQ